MLYSIVLKYKKVDNNDVLYNHCDILAPCAVGNVITEYNVSKLNCKLICGGANNIVSNNKTINYMHKKGIVFVPDYVLNAGGVIATMPLKSKKIKLKMQFTPHTMILKQF